MSNQEQFKELIYKHASGMLTAAEEKEFIQLLKEKQNDPLYEEVLWELYQQSDELKYWSQDFRENFANIIMKKHSEKARVYHLKSFIRYAAAVLIIIAIGAYLWINNKKDDKILSSNTLPATNIIPGKEGAILTLADGRKVILDSLNNGLITTQNGARVILYNGTLSYNSVAEKSADITYNTMSTPKGRQFKLVLPDGSTVWLNAASSIKYPTVFNGNERLVEIEGEAFFQVTQDAKMPFRIKTQQGTEIEVLGTSFNVNSYKNEEAVKTTLVEGAIKVKTDNQSAILQPNQQALAHSGVKVHVVNADEVSQVTAWKNGYFDFNNADLRMMMRQLERWYDIDVEYDGRVPEVVFKGKMDRNVQLNDVVRFLKIFGIKAGLNGRTLIISGN